MSNMKKLGESLASGETYNSMVTIRAVEDKEEKLVVKAIANKFLDANGAPVEDNHGTILTQATLDTSRYMEYNSVVLAHHNNERPVGKVTHLSMKEDGMEVILEVYKDNDPQIFNQVRRGTLNALSVGMFINKSEYSEILDAVIIREAELVEISLVTNPSNPLSFIESVDMCSLGVCSAIRSGSKEIEGRSVDKEAFKAMIKDMVDNGEIDLTPKVVEPEVVTEDPVVEPVVEPEVVTEDPVVEPVVEDPEPVVEPVVEDPAPIVKPEPVVEPEVVTEDPVVEEEDTKAIIKEIIAEEFTAPKSFEDRLEEAAIAFGDKDKELTAEQVNLLTFIVMNYGDIDSAVKQHLEK